MKSKQIIHEANVSNNIQKGIRVHGHAISVPQLGAPAKVDFEDSKKPKPCCSVVDDTANILRHAEEITCRV